MSKSVVDRKLNLQEYRERPLEKARISDLMAVVPKGRQSVLEIGARDGHLSRLLTRHFPSVTALDLEKPSFSIAGVTPVQGDVTALQYPDNSFDVVFCTEVLEHIPRRLLGSACREIARVSRYEIVIGVPYRQDIRVGRTRCPSCGRANPPWGHVNRFDEARLRELFPGLAVASTTFVGTRKEGTNFLAAFLMDLGGNPWGTYEQEEPCIHCGKRLVRPPEGNMVRKVFAALGYRLERAQHQLLTPTRNWIHVVFSKA